MQMCFLSGGGFVAMVQRGLAMCCCLYVGPRQGWENTVEQGFLGAFYLCHLYVAFPVLTGSKGAEDKGSGWGRPWWLKSLLCKLDLSWSPRARYSSSHL